MPTGYTAGILDGTITTFPQYVKRCMRAFGATVHLKDESLEAEYVPRVPSDYHLKNIETLKQSIIDVKKMTDDEIINLEKQQLERDKKNHLESIKKAKKNGIKLKKILSDVRKWQPPTKDHIAIKDFMIDQIQQTIEWDCEKSYDKMYVFEIETKLQNINASEIRKQKINDLNKMLAYHILENTKEIESCEKSNQWVKDLLQSLNP